MKRMYGRSSATPDSRLRVLYDGGPFVYTPDGPAAVHLLELLEAIPESIDPWLALPGQGKHLPACKPLQVIVEPAQDRLRWEQATLPAVVRRARPDLIHLTTARAPLFSQAPCVISPADLTEISMTSGLLPRLSASLGRGGLSRARAVFWPRDLPDPRWKTAGIHLPVMRLPPYVHSTFSQPQTPAIDLPDAFVFCPGPLSEADISSLASAWRWVVAGPGENYTLLVEGLSEEQQEQMEQAFDRAVALPTIQPILLHHPSDRAAVFQKADLVLYCGGVMPWGDSLLQALACGRPIAAVETPDSDSRLGPAGYLAPPDDARTLGAAIITLLVEEPLREQITAAAQERAAAWQSDQFSTELENAYWQTYRRATAT